MNELLHLWFNVYHYLWNIGVPGNLLASIIWVPIAAMCITIWTKAKVIKPMIKRHEEQIKHETLMIRSQQIIHDKLHTGHILSQKLHTEDIFAESMKDATPGNREIGD